MSSLNDSSIKFHCIMFSGKTMENRTPAEDIYKNIGNNIAQARKQLNITQQELADKINSTRQTITLYENGVRRIPVVTLVDIAKSLHVELSELLPEYQKKKPGPTPKIKQSFERIIELEEHDQKIIIDLLDTLHQKSRN